LTPSIVAIEDAESAVRSATTLIGNASYDGCTSSGAPAKPCTLVSSVDQKVLMLVDIYF